MRCDPRCSPSASGRARSSSPARPPRPCRSASDASREHVVIVRDDVPVGYFQLDRDSVPGRRATRSARLARVADRPRRPGPGRGARGEAALPAYVRDRFPDRRRVALTVNVTNPAAIAVYRRAGFADTGEVYVNGPAGPQHVLVLELTS